MARREALIVQENMMDLSQVFSFCCLLLFAGQNPGTKTSAEFPRVSHALQQKKGTFGQTTNVFPRR
jgi:hypothetical protein